jgi:ribokinase
MEQSQKIDLLSIGDVFNDTFIELEDAHVTCAIDKTNCTISMKFGDKLPYKSATLIRGVGNAGNAATSAARLGLSSALLTFTGHDDDGEKIVQHFRDEHVSDIFMTKDPTLPTNNAYVLEYGAERTILVKQEAYPYTIPNDLLAANPPAWIYLTSLGKTTLAFHHDLAAWVTAHPDTKLAFQPGTFQLQLGKDELSDIYRATYLFFCNVEEAQRILATEERDVKLLMQKIRELGPKIVSITDGPNGAYASDGTDAWFMPIFPDIAPPLQRTGAGDAFASTFTSALASGLPIEEALMWGPINSMNVVQHIGAQTGLLYRKDIEAYLAKAPEDYKAKKI